MIPKFISDKFNKKEFFGEIIAGTMFVDISGFTSMTQELMKNGKEGVEILTDAMNYIYSPSIKYIMQARGFISSFAGDAFTAIFPINTSSLELFFTAATQISELFKARNRFSSEFADFNINVKIGLSYGKVKWNIIESSKYYSYFFDGEAIAGCSQAEQKANPSEIVISNELYEIAKDIIKVRQSEDGFYKLIEVKLKDKHNNIQIKKIKKNLKPFIPEEILNLKDIGEFRKVISCFISLKKGKDFIKAISKIMELAIFYKGYFNKIDFGDKGYVILVIFGAPVIPDNMFKRAAEFVLRVKNIKNVSTKIGISFGVTYSGFIGSELRKEYTSIGMAVNLAARLMMKAEQNEVLAENNIKENLSENYQLDFIGKYHFKGFNKEISAYALIKKLDDRFRIKKYVKFINREQEKGIVRKILGRINRKSKAEILYVHGREGVGKTSLIANLKENAKKLNWRILSCDAIIQKSFYPLKSDLKEYFMINDENDFNENLIEFNLKFDEIKDIFKDGEKAEYIKEYLLHFLDLRLLSHENLPKNLLQKNIISAVSDFYRLVINKNFTVFVLDESDFMDDETIEFYNYFLNLYETEKTLFVFVYNDKKPPIKSYLRENELILMPFDKKNAHNQIFAILKNHNINLRYIPKKTFELIYEKTEGVPLFVEQTVNYLLENNLIDESGNLVKENFEIPSDISLLVISKIDKFEPEFKKITKAASVLGKKFSDNLLGLVVKEQNLEKFIIDGEKEDIWFSLSKLDHIFKSSLIRDSVYELILKKELQYLHQIVAESIKKLYKNNKESYYADIAYNYLKAKNKEKAKLFFKKAATYSIKRYELSDAVNYLKELYKIDKKIKTLLELIETILLKGKPQEAKKYISAAKEMPLSKNEKEKLILLETKYYVAIQDYLALEKFLSETFGKIRSIKIKRSLSIYLLDAYRALNKENEFLKLSDKLIKKIPKNSMEYAKLLNNVGIFYLNKSVYDKAKRFFSEYLELSKRFNDKIAQTKALHNIGIIHSRTGNREEAKTYYMNALEISIKIGDDTTTVKLLSDLASIYSINNQVEKALKLYDKALKINKKTSNRFQQGILFYNIAEAYFRLEKYDVAIEYVKKSIDICNTIKDIIGVTFAYDLLGDIYFSVERYKEAENIYHKNLKLQKMVKDPEGIAHTYGNLGNLCKVKKDYPGAEKYYKKQIKMLKKVGDIEGEGKAWFNWAMVETELKNYESAKEKLKNAIELFEKCSFKYGYELACEQMDKLKKPPKI